MNYLSIYNIYSHHLLYIIFIIIIFIINSTDDLSRKDPIQYQQFISEQFSNQKKEEEQDSNSNDKDNNRKSFRPTGMPLSSSP